MPMHVPQHNPLLAQQQMQQQMQPPMMQPGFAGPPVGMPQQAPQQGRFMQGLQDNSGMLMALGSQLMAHRQNAQQPMFDPQALMLGQQVDEKRRDRRAEKDKDRKQKFNTAMLMVKEGVVPNLSDAFQMIDASPELALKRLEQKFTPEKPGAGFTLSPGQQRFDAQGNPIAELPGKPEKPPTSFQEFQLSQQDPAFGEHLLERRRAGAPSVNIDQRGETKFAEELSKLDAQRVNSVTDTANTAHRNLGEIERMRAALESGRFTPGAFGEGRHLLSQMVELVGINPEEVGLGLGDPATADTLDAASKKLAAEAAKDLGRITNMSLGFIRDSLPALTRTPEGNAIIIEVMERSARREIEIAQIADEYAGRYGTLRPKDAPSFFEARNELEKRDPVITPELRQRIIEGSRTAPQSWRDVLGGGTPIPPEAAQILQRDPSPEAQREFDEVFGRGAARRVLGGR